MARAHTVCCLLSTFLVLGGCSGAGSSSPHTHAESAAAVPTEGDQVAGAALPAASSGPDEVVVAFLAALRDGDEQAAAGLLTSKARDEAARHDLVVQPPGTPSAIFSVGDITYIDEAHSGAHVHSAWTERDNGADYEIVWALRRQPDGWRIAGMATEIIPGQRPVFLNFEDPGDMLEKWQRAEEIAARHSTPAAGGTLTR